MSIVPLVQGCDCKLIGKLQVSQSSFIHAYIHVRMYMYVRIYILCAFVHAYKHACMHS